eukprot:4661102-Prymnesium_polylepis.1
MSGASASTAPPAVRRTIDSTSSRPKPLAELTVLWPRPFTNVAGILAHGATNERNGGTRPMASSTTSHCTGNTPRTAGPRASTDTARAARPSDKVIRLNPDPSIRLCIAVPAAMPTSAQGPH